MKKFLLPSLCIALPLLIGAIGSWFTSTSVETWYPTLVKPPFQPPSFVFGPVWTALYVMMGLSFYLVLMAARSLKDRRFASILFALQLALNFSWSVAFFGLHHPFLALIVIASLWAAILANILCFHPMSRLAAYLLLPYLAWVSFASYLNFMIWQLN